MVSRSSVGRHVALGLIVAATMVTAPNAAAYGRQPLLETVASAFAMRPADVRCPSPSEWINDPIWGRSGPQTAWGYTDMLDDYIVLHPQLCSGAIAVSDATVPAWQRATGILVLVHEAYHLRRWKWRRNEARVECEAIRQFTTGAKLLGASTPLANDLLPYALAAHARMVRLFPNYRARRCTLPLWAPPMSP
jgi:hypothetical protein